MPGYRHKNLTRLFGLLLHNCCRAELTAWQIKGSVLLPGKIFLR